MDSLHGTAISIMQLLTKDKPGTDREPIHIDTNTANNESVSSLPAEYSEVPPVALPRTELFAPVSEGPAKTESTVMWKAVRI